MVTRKAKLYIAAMLVLGTALALGIFANGSNVSQAQVDTAALAKPAQGLPAAQDNGGAIYTGLRPVERFDISPPLRDIPQSKVDTNTFNQETEDDGPLPTGDSKFTGAGTLQTILGPLAIPTPVISFDGHSNLCGCAPPDPNGDVGPNHFVTMANLHFQVFNKSGVSVLGPLANNTLWAGFGGPCQTENAGDPIVLYDQLADRWLLTQFTAAGPTYYNCVALSTTPDPTGSYYRYAINNGSQFPDYPKYGMMPEAYYIATRNVTGGESAGAFALNRAQMLVGDPNPQIISFLVPSGSQPYRIGNGLLPADLDGTNLRPPGTPQYFIGTQDQGGPLGAPSDAINIWEFVADFVTPANSSFTLASTVVMTGGPFDTQPAFCAGRSCVPQAGTSFKIDHLGYRQRPTFRAAYRNFNTHESIVTNQSVEASATMSGIRWWEIRSPDTNPVLYQDATYAPGITDGIHRWMGSAAMDASGNMALAYSASSTTIFPGLRYTGRLATDPINTMPQGEGVIVEGTGAQTGGGNRWGDYTDLVVDPVDDCTFWHTNEYIPVTSAQGWRLRVGAFRLPNCVTGGGTPTSTVTGTPPTATRTSSATQTRTVTQTVVPSATTTPTSGPCNPTPITINDAGPASPYPSNINITGMGGTVTDVNVILNGLNHTWPDDVDMLLVGPGGQTANIMSDAGGSLDIVAANVTLDDEAATQLPDSGQISSGSYRPANYEPGTDTFPAPAPAPGTNALLSVFDGTSANGTWSLYIVDDTGADVGNITGGWCLVITTTGGGSTPSTTNTAVSSPTSAGTVTPGATATCAPVAATWTDRAAVPVNRGRALGVTVGNDIYVFGGRPDNTTFETTVYRYNTVANSWTLETGVLPDAFTSNMSGGLLTFPEGPRVFIAGGSGASSAVSGRTLAYNPANNTFTAKAAWPAAPARIPGGWAVVNNKFYIFGGFESPATLHTDVWMYDPTTNAWTEIALELSVARGYIATELMPDGMVYLAGGFKSDGAGGFLDDTTFEKFNPATNTLTAGPAMPQASSNNHGYNVNGKFIVPAGGYEAANHTTDVKLYDPATNAWSLTTPALHATRNYAKGYGPGGTIYAIGGLDPGATVFYNFTQQYTPAGGPCPTGTTVVGTSTATAVVSTPTTVGGTPTGTPCPASFTQNASLTPVPGSIACSNQTTGFTTENSYYRLFPMSNYVPAGSNYGITSVDIGIEEADAPAGSQQITVRLHRSSANPPTLASLTLVSSVDVTVVNQSATLLNVPIAGTFASTDNLVVEVFSSDGTVAPEHTFFIGSNGAGQTGPSYIRAPACGLTNISTFASINFPNVHIIMRVNGGCQIGSPTVGPTGTSTVAPSSTRTVTSIVPTITAVNTAVPSVTAVSTAVPSGTAMNTVVATSTTGVATQTRTTVPLATATVCPIQFADVTMGDTFYGPIRCLVCRYIISGYQCGGTNPQTGQPEPCNAQNQGYFRQFNNVVRGQIAKMVSNSAGFSEAPGAQIYQDVPSTDTFFAFINRLTNRGLMGGYPCGGPGEPCVNNRPYFRPYANATRGQVAKIVSNGAGFNEAVSGQTFQDVPTNHPFYPFIMRLANRNIVTGFQCGSPGEPCVNNRPYFRPNTLITRGQTAQIVARAFFPNCVTP